MPFSSHHIRGYVMSVSSTGAVDLDQSVRVMWAKFSTGNRLLPLDSESPKSRLLSWKKQFSSTF